MCRDRKCTEETLTQYFAGHNTLFVQQQDLARAQFQGQLTIEDNIKRLIDEKRLITDSHVELTILTRDVQEKLAKAAEQLEKQSSDTDDNHKELIWDLNVIHEKAQNIYEKIG